MISLFFFKLKQFDLSISQLKMSDIISFEITLEFKYLKISF